MSFSKKLYMCTQYKSFTENVNDLLLVDNKKSRFFCSEKCIEDFYAALVLHYREVEKKLRQKFEISSDEFSEIAPTPQILEKTFREPDEIWHLQNDVREEMYSMISHYEDYSVMILCLMLDYRPSFVFLTTASRDERFVREFQIGKKIQDLAPYRVRAEDDADAIEIDQEAISLLENKKSQLLATLLERRIASDIPFEYFSRYEQFYKETLENPDEIYHWKDAENDELYSYIKVHESGGISFYYVVVCIGKIIKQLLPIMSFPTLDPNLYKYYKKGSLVSGKLKN